MFLEALVRRNRSFLEAVIGLHQKGLIPANSYVLDVDAIRANTQVFGREAVRLGLTTFPMTKQLGRNPVVMRVLAEAGLRSFVAVDMGCARRIAAEGFGVGHIGHLVQVPRAEAAAAAATRPDYWTVFSHQKARDASSAAGGAGRTQALLARIHAPGDVFYMGHEGGFAAGELGQVADSLDELDHARFAGITTFPALLFDEDAGRVVPTPNLATLSRAAEALGRTGRSGLVVNAPGTTSVEVLPLLTAAGATQVEPGHGLTGTTPLHAVRDLPEIPAVAYLSEVSHFHGGRAYCFGGGLYIDPVFRPYRVRALVGRVPEQALADRVDATLPPPEAIDYYGLLDLPVGRTVEEGDSVVFGFRIQAFVTRAFVVPISGAASSPEVLGVWTTGGTPARWP